MVAKLGLTLQGLEGVIDASKPYYPGSTVFFLGVIVCNAGYPAKGNDVRVWAESKEYTEIDDKTSYDKAFRFSAAAAGFPFACKAYPIGEMVTKGQLTSFNFRGIGDGKITIWGGVKDDDTGEIVYSSVSLDVIQDFVTMQSIAVEYSKKVDEVVEVANRAEAENLIDQLRQDKDFIFGKVVYTIDFEK